MLIPISHKTIVVIFASTCSFQSQMMTLHPILFNNAASFCSYNIIIINEKRPSGYVWNEVMKHLLSFSDSTCFIYQHHNFHFIQFNYIALWYKRIPPFLSFLSVFIIHIHLHRRENVMYSCWQRDAWKRDKVISLTTILCFCA